MFLCVISGFHKLSFIPYKCTFSLAGLYEQTSQHPVVPFFVMCDNTAAKCVSTQGGENRRILLDMKTVLEEVQLEVKREEEKRSELQLQYTRDKCSWELEKAELKRRIAQVTPTTVCDLCAFIF